MRVTRHYQNENKGFKKDIPVENVIAMFDEGKKIRNNFH